jgi:hypothetical protein
MPVMNLRPTALTRLSCVLLLGLGMAASGCSTSNRTEAKNDERIAYCLGETRQAALVDVAIRLGIARPESHSGQVVTQGTRLTLEQWQSRHGTEFNRACDALMAANGHPVRAQPSSTPAWLTDLLATVKAVLLLLAGAALTLLTGGLRDAGTRRRLQAAQLRNATDNFVAACEAFLEDQIESTRTGTADQSVRDRRQELIAKLRETQALYPNQVDPSRPLSLLTGELDRSIQRDWELSSDETARRQRMDRIRNALTSLIGSVEAINQKLHRSALARLGGTK